MQQHPVPQDITGYKFHLVGDMTLKQFAELASGIVLAWIIFSSQLNFLFKWTLGPITAFFGFALAFIPIENRPLDKWVINFLKAIYNPTQYIWQNQPKKLDIFSTQSSTPRPQPTIAVQTEKLEEYLSTLPQTPSSAFDQAEQQYLEHIHGLFSALGVPAQKPSQADITQPPLPSNYTIKGVRVRKLNTPQMCLLPHTNQPAPPEPQTAAMPANVKKTLKQTNKPTPTKPSVLPKPKPPILPNTKPTTTKPSVLPKPKPPILPNPKPTPTKPLVLPNFAKDIILPQTPDKPNLLTGITLNKQDKIIPNVILEIKDSKNQPVRALKSNKLGQFFIATPLPDGIYHLSAEHPNLRFDIIKLEAKGEIIPPLKIKSQN